MTCWIVYSPQLLWTKRRWRHRSRRWRSISSRSRIRSASDTLSAKEVSNQLRPLPSIWQLFAIKLAIDCDFASKELLEEALRDRLVSGVCSAALRKKLLTMKDLTFAEACETAKSMEAAEADAKAIASISTPAVPATVQLVSKHQRWRGKQSSSHSPPQDKQQPCYRCGRRNHLPHQCKFRDAICHACGERPYSASLSIQTETATRPAPIEARSDWYKG